MCQSYVFFFFSSRRRHTRYWRDWSSDVCSSDLLGVGLEFAKGEGPVIHRPVRSEADVARLAPVDVASAVGFVFETVRLVRRALPPHVPLIGFAGAPFTVASYVVEGGASRDYLATKRLMR